MRRESLVSTCESIGVFPGALAFAKQQGTIGGQARKSCAASSATCNPKAIPIANPAALYCSRGPTLVRSCAFQLGLDPFVDADTLAIGCACDFEMDYRINANEESP